MARLYYDCPIEAAYMAKNFGVIYQSSSCLESEKLVGYYSEDGATAMFTLENQRKGKPPRLFYVHPDSLPIFEPQEGDVINGNDQYGAKLGVILSITKDKQHANIAGACKTIGLDLSYKYARNSIIQRNNRAFIMPRQEEK